MFDFVKFKSVKYWRFMFHLFLVIVVLETAIFLFAFFLMPNDPVSNFDSLMKLPAKYLFLVLIGGLSKEFLMGYFTCYSYLEWKRLKNVKA